MRGNRVVTLFTLALVGLVLLSGCSINDSDPPEPGPTESPPTSIPTTNGEATKESGPTVNVNYGVNPTSSEACIAQTDGNGYMQAEGLKDGMNCVVGLYAWPATRVPNESTVASMVDSMEGAENARFQEGYDYMRVSLMNTCAWSQEWLDARGADDSDRQQYAMEYLTTVGVDPVSHIAGFPTNALDPSVTQGYQTVFDQAVLGDPSPMQEYVSSSCGDIEWPAQ